MGFLLLHIAAGRQSLLLLFKFVTLPLRLPKGKDPRISFRVQRFSSAT